MKFIIEIWYYDGKKNSVTFREHGDVIDAVHVLLRDNSVCEFKVIKETT